MFHRHPAYPTTALPVIVALSVAFPAQADPLPLPCETYPNQVLLAPAQVVHLPPLIEGADGYVLHDPGRMGPELALSLEETATLALCMAEAQNGGLGDVHLTVFAGVDAREARSRWLSLVEPSSLGAADERALANALVDITAVHGRGTLIARALRDKLADHLERQGTDDGQPVDTQLAGVVDHQLTIEPLPAATVSLPHPAAEHPRGFAILLRVHGGATPSPTLPSPVAAPSPAPTIQFIMTPRVHERPAPRIAGARIAVDGRYIRAFDADHLGAAVSVDWRLGTGGLGATADTPWGYVLGGRLGVLAADRAYRLAPDLRAPMLPDAGLSAGLWTRLGPVAEARIDVFGGAILPAVAAVVALEPGLSLRLPEAFELRAHASMGGMPNLRTGLWGASAGFARVF